MQVKIGGVGAHVETTCADTLTATFEEVIMFGCHRVSLLDAFALLLATIPAGIASDAFVTELASDEKIELTAGDWTDVKALIQKSSGKVVVVDVWSTSCLPCMKEFPNLIELKKKYGDQIVCISLNVDFVGIRSRPPERYRPRVEAFLKKSEATIPNILCTKAADELFEELELTSIPAVYVFGKDGKKVKRFDSSMLEDGKEEAFTYKDDINPLVEQLVADAD